MYKPIFKNNDEKQNRIKEEFVYEMNEYRKEPTHPKKSKLDIFAKTYKLEKELKSFYDTLT